MVANIDDTQTNKSSTETYTKLNAAVRNGVRNYTQKLKATFNNIAIPKFTISERFKEAAKHGAIAGAFTAFISMPRAPIAGLGVAACVFSVVTAGAYSNCTFD